MTVHIKIACPKCSHSLKVRSEYLGRRGSCKHCQAEFTLEAPPESAAQAAKIEPTHGTGTALWEPKPSADPEQNLKLEVERLKRYISSLNKERTSLRSDFEQAQTQLAKLQPEVARLASLEEELQSSRSDLADAKTKAKHLAAELETANQRWERLRDELEAEHAGTYQNATSLAEIHRLEAETWKSRHDEKEKTLLERVSIEAEENVQLRSELRRVSEENEALTAQLGLSQTRRQAEADDFRNRIDACETERIAQAQTISHLQDRFQEQLDARLATEAVTADLRRSLAAADAKHCQSVSPQELRVATDALEAQLKRLSDELDASNAARTELECKLSRNLADMSIYQKELVQARAFKEQIRSFLAGLGINLPEA